MGTWCCISDRGSNIDIDINSCYLAVVIFEGYMIVL